LRRHEDVMIESAKDGIDKIGHDRFVLEHRDRGRPPVLHRDSCRSIPRTARRSAPWPDELELAGGCRSCMEDGGPDAGFRSVVLMAERPSGGDAPMDEEEEMLAPLRAFLELVVAIYPGAGMYGSFRDPGGFSAVLSLGAGNGSMELAVVDGAVRASQLSLAATTGVSSVDARRLVRLLELLEQYEAPAPEVGPDDLELEDMEELEELEREIRDPVK